MTSENGTGEKSVPNTMRLRDLGGNFYEHLRRPLGGAMRAEKDNLPQNRLPFSPVEALRWQQEKNHAQQCKGCRYKDLQ